MGHRINDSAFLFGVNKQNANPGSWHTDEETTCDVCKKTHNERPPFDQGKITRLNEADCSDDERYTIEREWAAHEENWDDRAEDKCYQKVFGLVVCEDCFDRVERWIVSNMNDIAPWYRNALNAEHDRVRKALALLNGEAVGGLRDMDTSS